MEFFNSFLQSIKEVEFIAKFIELVSDDIVFNIGFLLIIGYAFGKIAKKFRLPSITGYIVAGLLVGHSALNLVSKEISHSMHNLTDVALSLIALTIGGEFKIAKLKRAGKNILILTLFESLFAFVAVTLVLTLFLDIKFSLLLGAISAATAPAATVIIIKELRARGTFVDYLYGVVAFDDAVCVILFSIIFSVISPMLLTAGVGAAANSGLLTGLMHAFSDLFFSFLIGLMGGFLLNILIRRKYKLNEILILSIAAIFVCTALAIVLHLSPLISNMVFGAVLVNTSPKNSRVFSVLEPVTPPLFALFFILAGMELDIGVLTKGLVVVYGLIYIVARFGGKMLGVHLACKLTDAPEKVKKYLGFCLFPQAGVAIGLVLFVETSPVLAAAGPEMKMALDLILNIVLVSVFLNELVGPSISRYGIVKGADL